MARAGTAAGRITPLAVLFERNDSSRISAAHRVRIERILDYLHQARSPADMNFAGLRLHQLSGDLKGYWSVTVSANWRIIFRFHDSDVVDVDLVDYH